MTQTLLRRLTLASACLLAAPTWAIDTFTGQYQGAGTSNASCGYSYNIAGAEPSTAGTYPVFVYMVGTTETYTNASATAAVNSMAAKGYVAASIDYASSAFGACATIAAKASCAFNPASPASAISQICSRAKADCSKGIVVAGFSQGSVMAILAKNYDSRVQAAYGLGAGVKYSVYDLSSCVANGKRVLGSDRLRAVNGESDGFMGYTTTSVRGQLQKLTGLDCGANAYACENTANNSGWYLIKDSEVSDGNANHCYMRKGGCLVSENSLDAVWKTSTTGGWALEPNLQWLTQFTKK